MVSCEPLNREWIGHPAVIHFIRHAAPPGDWRLAFSRGRLAANLAAA